MIFYFILTADTFQAKTQRFYWFIKETTIWIWSFWPVMAHKGSSQVQKKKKKFSSCKQGALWLWWKMTLHQLHVLGYVPYNLIYDHLQMTTKLSCIVHNSLCAQNPLWSDIFIPKIWVSDSKCLKNLESSQPSTQIWSYGKAGHRLTVNSYESVYLCGLFVKLCSSLPFNWHTITGSFHWGFFLFFPENQTVNVGHLVVKSTAPLLLQNPQ